MFIPDFVLFEIYFVLSLVDFFEDILESTVVTFQDGIFRRQVQWVVLKAPSIDFLLSAVRSSPLHFYLFQCVLKARVSKTGDRLVGVVHGQGNTAGALEVEHFDFLCWRTIGWRIFQCDTAGILDHHVLAPVLITERVTTDDDGLFPSGDQQWNRFANDRLAKDSSTLNRFVIVLRPTFGLGRAKYLRECYEWFRSVITTFFSTKILQTIRQ